MKLTIEIKGQSTIVTCHGKTRTHKTAFLKSLSYKDAFHYITEK